MIEAIVTIFRDLDLNEPTAFDYELDYEIRDHAIRVSAQAGYEPKVIINDEAANAWEINARPVAAPCDL